MTSARPTTAPDGIERLRRAKRHLADFDSELADARTADVPLTVASVHIRLPNGGNAIDRAVQMQLNRELDDLLAAARELLVADVEAAKLAAREEYEKELAAIH